MTDRAVVAARRAGPSDVDAVAMLLARCVEGLRAGRGGTELIADLSDRCGVDLTVHAGRWKVSSEALALVPPRFWLGEKCGLAVGLAWGRTALYWDQGPQLGVVDLLYVDGEQCSDVEREQVGAALVGEIASFFRAEGCAAFDCLVLPGDRAVKSVLESSGMKARLITMSRRL